MPFILKEKIPIEVTEEKYREWLLEPKNSIIKTSIVEDKFIQTFFIGYGDSYRYETQILDDIENPQVIHYKQVNYYWSDAYSLHRQLTTNILNGNYEFRSSNHSTNQETPD